MRKLSLSLIGCLALAPLAHATPAYAGSVTQQPRAIASQVDASTHGKTPRVITIPRTSKGAAMSEEERYAVREAISNEAKNFRGGDPIVITATAAVIILLAVIIIILLT